MRRALVTGAAGFIGCHLVDALQQAGWEVAGIDNERSGDWSRVAPACRRLQADLAALSTDELLGLCRDTDVVFHLAAEKYNSARGTPQQVIDVNVSATRRLYEAAALAQRPKVVFTSSLYAYGSMGPDPMHETDIPEPHTVYGISKVAGEHMLRVDYSGHHLAWSVARLFFIYGPRQFAEGGYKSVIVANFERLARGEQPTVFGDGLQALDYVYVDDCVEALLELAAAEHNGKTVNICSGNATTVNELTEAMIAVSGSSLRPRACPPDWTAGSRRVGDPARAAAELGWKATTSIGEGLQHYWNWLEHEQDARG